MSKKNNKSKNLEKATPKEKVTYTPFIEKGTPINLPSELLKTKPESSEENKVQYDISYVEWTGIDDECSKLHGMRKIVPINIPYASYNSLISVCKKYLSSLYTEKEDYKINIVIFNISYCGVMVTDRYGECGGLSEHIKIINPKNDETCKIFTCTVYAFDKKTYSCMTNNGPIITSERCINYDILSIASYNAFKVLKEKTKQINDNDKIFVFVRDAFREEDIEDIYKITSVSQLICKEPNERVKNIRFTSVPIMKDAALCIYNTILDYINIERIYFNYFYSEVLVNAKKFYKKFPNYNNMPLNMIDIMDMSEIDNAITRGPIDFVNKQPKAVYSSIYGEMEKKSKGKKKGKKKNNK